MENDVFIIDCDKAKINNIVKEYKEKIRKYEKLSKISGITFIVSLILFFVYIFLGVLNNFCDFTIIILDNNIITVFMYVDAAIILLSIFYHISVDSDWSLYENALRYIDIILNKKICGVRYSKGYDCLKLNYIDDKGIIKEFNLDVHIQLTKTEESEQIVLTLPPQDTGDFTINSSGEINGVLSINYDYYIEHKIRIEGGFYTNIVRKDKL